MEVAKMNSFVEIFLGVFIAVIAIYGFLRLCKLLVDNDMAGLANAFKVIVVLIYISFVIWFPNLEYKIYFGIFGFVVYYLFSKNILQTHKLNSSLIIAAVFGFLWINASPYVWSVLYPPKHTAKPVKNELRVPSNKKDDEELKSIRNAGKEIVEQRKKSLSKNDTSNTNYDNDFDPDDDFDAEMKEIDAELNLNDSEFDDDISTDIPSYHDLDEDTNSLYDNTHNSYGGGGYSSSSTDDVYVAPYVKSNGQYVKGHYRTRANDTTLDNYSHRGNINPYTGKRGYNKNY